MISMEVSMKIISDYTTQEFSKPYNFRINVYKENENEYMSIDVNVKHGEHICELSIPKIDLSEMIIDKKSNGYLSQMLINFKAVPVSDEQIYASIKDLDFDK
jgi:sortase (surface protein transpeptidase)